MPTTRTTQITADRVRDALRSLNATIDKLEDAQESAEPGSALANELEWAASDLRKVRRSLDDRARSLPMRG